MDGDGDTITDPAVEDTLVDGSSPAPATGGLPERPRDRYERLGEIARGGMGRIVAVRDRELDRRLAIKELLYDDPPLVRRFEREVHITARLQHPSIIRVLEAGRWSDGAPFFIMEHVEGRPMDEVLSQSGELEERIALLPHVIDVVEALAYAHSQSVVHRDLKPGNVLIGSFGETVVIDWGLAKPLGDSDSDGDSGGDTMIGDDGIKTALGAAMGTPAYMPPEQARGEPVDRRADVYALGAMLYHLIAGRVPYADVKAAGGLELVEIVKERGPTPLEPGAPADLLTIAAKAMAREPGDRYADAGELYADLKRFEAGQLVSAHRYSTGELVRRWVARHRAAVAVAALMTAVLAAGAVVGVTGIARERDRARRAQVAAESNRAEAEELVDFMLVSLNEKLAPLGRLPVLDMVAREAAEYYARRPLDWSRPREVAARATARANLAGVLVTHGDFDAALSEASAALETRRELSRRMPGDLDAQLALSDSHQQVGEIRFRRGDLDAATRAFRAALELRSALAARAPARGDLREAMSWSHLGIGDVLRLRGDFAAAIGELETARALLADLADREPDEERWRQALASALEMIAKVFIAAGEPDRALERLAQSLAIRERLAAADPGSATRAGDLATSHHIFGGTLRRLGRIDEALASADRAIEIVEALARRDPTNRAWRRELAHLSLMAGSLLVDRGDREAGEARLSRSVNLYNANAVGPKDYYNAACARARLGDADGAFAMLDAAASANVATGIDPADDADLASLRGDPRWPAILSRLRGGRRGTDAQ